jgi:hypothetical protein
MTVKIRNITGEVKLEKQFDVVKLEENKETITLYFQEGGVLSVSKNEWEVKE